MCVPSGSLLDITQEVIGAVTRRCFDSFCLALQVVFSYFSLLLIFCCRRAGFVIEAFGDHLWARAFRVFPLSVVAFLLCFFFLGTRLLFRQQGNIGRFVIFRVV